MGTVLNFKIPIYDDMAIEDTWFSEYDVYVAGTDGIELSVLPALNIVGTQIAGRDGESFVQSSYKSRELPLPMFIRDIDDLDSFKKLIMFREPKWIHFKNTKTKIKGIFTDEVLVKPFGRKGTFKLKLHAPDPHFYESEVSAKTIANPPSSFMFWNDGNTPSLPIYEITGKGTVVLGVNGLTMTISFSPSAYETLIIDTRFCEVRKASDNRQFSVVEQDFPELPEGINAFAITGDCTSITITPNSRWI